MNILTISSNVNRYYNYEDSTEAPEFSFTLHVGGFDSDIVDAVNLLKTPYTPVKGDKIYFLPAVNVPRIKFKNVCVEYGVKNIRDIEQANVIFGSKKSLYEMTDSCWKYKCPTKNFIDFFELVKDKMDDYDVEKTNTALEFYTNEFIAIDYHLAECIQKHFQFSNHYDYYSNKMVTVKDQYKDLFLTILDKEILDESSVINVLNGEDATEIDKVMFDHISDMFNSSDTDNHVLAMEIMANSKYVESLIYLELLFYKHSNTIYQTHSKNHVNFKSLISYLGKDKSYLDTSMDKIVDSLRDKDQLTPDKLDILLSYAAKDIQRNGDSQYFTVKTISVKPDILAELNSNYTYGMQADYVPTVVESPVEETLELEEPKDDLQEVESEFAAEDNFEVASEEELAHLLYGVDNEDIEVSLTVEEEEEDDTDVLETEPVVEVSESQSNNNQIKANDTNDFEWF
jgi:hypothetical protein